MLTGREHVAQERLVEPGDTERSARIADERLEDLEAGAAGVPQATTEDARVDRGDLSRPERPNRPEPAAVLVAQRESVQEIFDGRQARASEICGAAGTDAFEVLQRRRKKEIGLKGRGVRTTG
jgi:hypothetical protein